MDETWKLWMDGKYIPSLLAAIGEAIEGHMIAIGFLPEKAKAGKENAARLAQTGTGPAGGRPLRPCPKCGSASLLRQEGCDLCTSCGHSKCG